MVHRPNLYYSKKIPKKNIRFPLKQEKNTTSKTPSSTPHFDEWTRCFGHRDKNKLTKNKMDSKVIKTQKCSPEKSHALLNEPNSKL